MSKLDEKELMLRCFELARKGCGNVSPNPLVGCVIVKNGKIIGNGYHKQFGGPHAEIFALLQARNKAKGATLFVNLEPCAHFGKTPPCVDAIIKSGISNVVIASEDPNPLVSGKGIRRLRENGIQVKCGLLRKEALSLNEKFYKFMRTGYPYVGLKLAQTIDGRIADIKGRSKWITSSHARDYVHCLRSEYDAILVGAKTVLADNSQLTVRTVKRKSPIRIVLDGKLTIPVSKKIFNTHTAPTWIITSSSAIKRNRKKVRLLILKGVRVIDAGISTSIRARKILKILAQEGISSVLLEGGSHTVAEFIDQSLVDKLFLFIAPKIFGDGLEGIKLNNPRLLYKEISITNIDVSIIGSDILLKANFKH